MTKTLSTSISDKKVHIASDSSATTSKCHNNPQKCLSPSRPCSLPNQNSCSLDQTTKLPFNFNTSDNHSIIRRLHINFFNLTRVLDVSFNGIALEQNFDYTSAGPWLYHLYGTTLCQVGLARGRELHCNNAGDVRGNEEHIRRVKKDNDEETFKCLVIGTLPDLYIN